MNYVSFENRIWYTCLSVCRPKNKKRDPPAESKNHVARHAIIRTVADRWEHAGREFATVRPGVPGSRMGERPVSVNRRRGAESCRRCCGASRPFQIRSYYASSSHSGSVRAVPNIACLSGQLQRLVQIAQVTKSYAWRDRSGSGNLRR
jgi:hypothetical protein